MGCTWFKRNGAGFEVKSWEGGGLPRRRGAGALDGNLKVARFHWACIFPINFVKKTTPVDEKDGL